MTKTELVEKVAGTHNLSKKNASDVVGDVFDSMAKALQGGQKVTWPGFGSFSVSERAARMGRNPQTGEQIQIGASKSVKFKVAAGLKKTL